MRIARFTTGEDPQFGVVTGEVDEHGIPDEDCVVVALNGDPLYVGLHLSDKEYPLSEVFKEIYSDEARHIALNISVVQDIVAQRPENVNEVVEAHRDALPLLFQLFTSFKAINDEMGVDNEWFTMRCLFHHSQRIRRLHLPNEIAKVMLADTVAVAQSSK